MKQFQYFDIPLEHILDGCNVVTCSLKNHCSTFCNCDTELILTIHVVPKSVILIHSWNEFHPHRPILFNPKQ